jgi:hypothetical protein
MSHPGSHNKERIELLNFTEKRTFILKNKNFILRNLLNTADKIKWRGK